MIGEADYNALRQLTRARLQSELQHAIVLDIWKDFVHMGDGIHPTPETTKRAARIIADELIRRD